MAIALPVREREQETCKNPYWCDAKLEKLWNKRVRHFNSSPFSYVTRLRELGFLEKTEAVGSLLKAVDLALQLQGETIPETF